MYPKRLSQLIITCIKGKGKRTRCCHTQFVRTLSVRLPHPRHSGALQWRLIRCCFTPPWLSIPMAPARGRMKQGGRRGPEVDFWPQSMPLPDWGGFDWVDTTNCVTVDLLNRFSKNLSIQGMFHKMGPCCVILGEIVAFCIPSAGRITPFFTSFSNNLGPTFWSIFLC